MTFMKALVIFQIQFCARNGIKLDSIEEIIESYSDAVEQMPTASKSESDINFKKHLADVFLTFAEIASYKLKDKRITQKYMELILTKLGSVSHFWIKYIQFMKFFNFLEASDQNI